MFGQLPSGAIDPGTLQTQIDQLVSDMTVANGLIVQNCGVGQPCAMSADQAAQFGALFVNAQNLQTDLSNLRTSPGFDASSSDAQLQLQAFLGQLNALRDAFNILPLPIKSTAKVPTGSTAAGTVLMWAGIATGIAVGGIGVYYLWNRVSATPYRQPRFAGRRRRYR